MRLWHPICLTMLLGSAAAAQDRTVGLTLGAGVVDRPTYFGSDQTETLFAPGLRLDRLEWGPLDFGGTDPDGFGFSGGVRFIPERTAETDVALTGLDDVDFALELGGGVSYTDLPNGRDQQFGNAAFAQLRYGVLGHESFVAEFGADLIYAPTPQWDLRLGPRLFGGDDDYAATYFGVTADEAAGSAFDAFTPSGGILSRGVSAQVGYDFNDDWGVTGRVTYEQFLNDAADSPIVQQGSDEQLSVGVTLTRKLEFNF